jgi:hypothetical protein
MTRLSRDQTNTSNPSKRCIGVALNRRMGLDARAFIESTYVVRMPRVSPVKSNSRMTKVSGRTPWGRLSRDQTIPAIRQGSDWESLTFVRKPR